jgi:ubiquinone/menaquinone biosynthesis C-methylase UbiE
MTACGGFGRLWFLSPAFLWYPFFVKSNTEWEYWGRVDPLYGVSTVVGKSKSSSSPWTDEEFYSKGELDWPDFQHHWQHYGLNPDSCLEVGCGAGRMTRCLQKYFTTVHAVDVSEGMISYAKRHCDPSIVTFHLTSGDRLPLAANAVSAVFSVIVFQHLQSDDGGAGYFREIYRVLSPGGTIMINLPLIWWPQRPNQVLRIVYRAVQFLTNARAAFKRRMIKAGPRFMRTRLGRKLGDYMHATSYEVKWLYRILSEMGFKDIEIRVFYVKSEERPHPFVFARKIA